MKNTLTPTGIEPATIRYVAQHLNNCATAVLSHIVRYVHKFFFFKVRHPAVLDYRQKVHRQTIKTLLYDMMIYSATCFDLHGIVIRLISKTYYGNKHTILWKQNLPSIT